MATLGRAAAGGGWNYRSRHKAKGKRQKAKGKRHKAEGKKK
jgi:hypothetical protein